MDKRVFDHENLHMVVRDGTVSLQYNLSPYVVAYGSGSAIKIPCMGMSIDEVAFRFHEKMEEKEIKPIREKSFTSYEISVELATDILIEITAGETE